MIHDAIALASSLSLAFKQQKVFIISKPHRPDSCLAHRAPCTLWVRRGTTFRMVLVKPEFFFALICKHVFPHYSKYS